MDKYEYRVKLAQIEKLKDKQDYVTAAKIADSIDWRKVKSVTTLNMIADIYEATNRLEDCYEILNMVYDRSPIGRRVVFHMAEIAARLHDFKEAIDLYKEFVRIAPNDSNKYILKYEIYRERGSSVEDQISILEEYKDQEYNEHWAYELACLYEEAGMIDRCVAECDELILWFSEGEYVARAMELKMKYEALTASQQEKYKHRFDYMESEKAEEPPAEDVIEKASREESSEKEAVSEENDGEAGTQEETEPTASRESEEPETPRVSVVNVNKFSTMNLQEELARGLQMLLAEEEGSGKEEDSEAEPSRTKDLAKTKEYEAVEAAGAGEENAEAGKKEFSETAEEALETEGEESFKTAEEASETEREKLSGTEEVPETEVEKLSETAELHTEILKYAVTEPERKMDEFLRVDDDGQISLAVDEESDSDKQITGQMSIGEILEAWEEKKRRLKEQMESAGNKKTPVLFETGEISNVLEDFIPRTPKEVQQIIEELENEAAEEKGSPEEEMSREEAAESEDDWLKEPVREELEDDLPRDIEQEELSEEAAREPEEPKSIGQNTASMLDAIERALAREIEPLETAGNYLTEEQEKIFAYFTSVSGMRKQLVTLLADDQKYAGREDSKEGNLIITGYRGIGKTTLAIDIVKVFQKQRNKKGGKIAKVSGEGFNKKDPESVLKKLGGGSLIIEHAGTMTDETIEKLSAAMEENTGGLLVILEDDGREIERILEEHKGFAAKFDRSVNIPIFSNDELVAFGKSYAEEQEYYFDEMAVLALYDCIGIRQTSEHLVNVAEVKEIVDDAIAYAEKRSRGLFARLSKKRVDEYGNKLLLEEDFAD